MTLSDLIAAYRSDPDSSYRKLRFRSRQHMDGLCGRIDADYGTVEIADIRGRQLRRWHEDWIVAVKAKRPTDPHAGITMAHGLMGMLRTLVGFGFTILENEDCGKVSMLLHGLKFEMAKPRTVVLSVGQVIAVRRMAHAMGRHSVALAQALQFEGTLRQKDIIGEFVPVTEPGRNYLVTKDGWKWLRGIRWEEIDTELVLRHVTSKRQKEIEIDLKLAPMVLEELQDKFGLMSELPRRGPVIISEHSGLPYTAPSFRYLWRTIARAAGIPDDVRNMDTRAGAITEATDAGAPLELVRHAATHSDVSTTGRYSRGAPAKTAEVMRMRVAARQQQEVA
jgi:hypothetical protein